MKISKLSKKDIEQWDSELDAIEGLADQTTEVLNPNPDTWPEDQEVFSDSYFNAYLKEIFL